MKVEALDTSTYPIVHLGDTREGLLYLYECQLATRGKPMMLYVIASSYGGKRVFVDLETGDWYNGDRGELRLVDQAALVLGRPQ